MGKTVRRKTIPLPFWYWDEDEYWRWNADVGTCDGDRNPPSWFKKVQQKRFRRKQNQIIRCMDIENPNITSDYKMPWYT